MDSKTVFTKTSKGALEAAGKSRLLGREQARILMLIDGRSTLADLLEKAGRFSRSKLERILGQLLSEGFIRILSAGQPTVLAEQLGFSSTIIVDEADTRAFLEAQAEIERRIRQETRRVEAQREGERKALLEELAKEGGGHAPPKVDGDAPRRQPETSRQAAPSAPAPAADDAQPPAPAQAQGGEGGAMGARMREAEETQRRAEQEREAMARQLEEARLAVKLEARVKRRLEARAREEEQARRRAEEEARARAEAERRAREEAEARAAQEARAREEAERRAREEAEARARAEAEARALAEAERRAREEAEARQRERAEAERRSRELAAQRAAAEAAARAREEERAAAKAQAERAAREAAEEARRFAEEQARQLLEEEEREREAAQARAAALARLKTEQELSMARLLGGGRILGRLELGKWARRAATTVVVALLLALALAHLVSFDFYAPRLESRLQLTLGEPVRIGELRFRAFPAPRWMLEQVTIGAVQDIRIARAELEPSLGDWGWEVARSVRVRLEGVQIEGDALARLAAWPARQGLAPLKLERIELAGVKLALPGLDLPTFGGRLDWAGGTLRQAVLTTTDQRANVTIEPMADGYRVQLSALRWIAPIGTNLEFARLDVQGMARARGIDITQLVGEVYGGSLSGSGRVSWEQGWKGVLDLEIRNVNLAQAMPVFTTALSTEGTLDAKARVQLQGERLATLTTAPEVRATFVARKGAVGNVDLVRAIHHAARNLVSGGETRFDELSGYLQLAKGRYHYPQLRLKLGVLSAAGNVIIEPDHTLTGSITTELRAKAAAMRVPLTLAGTLATPTLRAKAAAPALAPPEQGAPAEPQP